MAIQWGGWANRLRVGIEWWVMNGPDGEGRVNVHVKLWMQTDYSYYDYDGSASVSGDVNGSGSGRLSNGNALMVKEWDASFTAFYGSQRTIYANVSGSSTAAGPASMSSSLRLPQRPYELPSAPGNRKVSRVADGRNRVSWTGNYTGDDGPRPWRSLRVTRKTAADPAWRTLATLPWNATSWEDTNAPMNGRVEYGVDSVNEAGTTGGWAGFVDSRPDAPTGVVATKHSDGSILVTWAQSASGQPDYISGYTIYDNGTLLATVPGRTVLSYSHQSPAPSTPHTYTVYANSTSPSLMSETSAPSNTVQILAPPNAPTNLAPNGTEWAIESGDPVLTWAHNPVDTSAQTRAEVQWRPAGGTWVTVPITGTAQKLTLSGAGVGSYEWQVRTQGAFHPGQADGWSPWSAVATFTLVNVPGTNISVPAEGPYTASSLTAVWTYYQAQSHAQVAAQVQVTSGDQTLIDQMLQGAVTSWEVPWTFLDGVSYVVRVRARSSYGLWSPWDQVSISVAYTPPPAPEVTASWDDTRGAAQVSVFNPGPIDPQPATVTNTVERSIDGGATWELVMDGLPLNGTLTDPESLSYGTTLYRVTAVSALPSSSVSDNLAFDPQDESAWINAGTNFTTAAHIPSNLRITRSLGKFNRTLVPIEGREYGMLVEGMAKEHAITVTGDVPVDVDSPLESDQTIQSLDAIPDVTNPAMLRLPDGTRWYGALTSYSRTNREQDRTATVSIAFERGNRE